MPYKDPRRAKEYFQKRNKEYYQEIGKAARAERRKTDPTYLEQKRDHARETYRRAMLRPERRVEILENMRLNGLSRRQRNRAYAMQVLGGVCIDCGIDEKLQFDHIDPSSAEFCVSMKLSCSWRRLESEVLKCQLLCGPCHKKRHRVDKMRLEDATTEILRLRGLLSQHQIEY